jgi:IS5 family transposase
MAKRCATEIQYSRGQDNRRRLYRKLIAAAHATRAALLRAIKLIGLAGVAAERWRARVEHYLPLIGRVLDQSERRVLRGQAVPASEKLVSLFEPHADIIVKSLPLRRQGALATCNTVTSSIWSPVRVA